MKQSLIDTKSAMRVVQTFWTAGKDPLKCSFGWMHAEHNLMSWALSCLCLRTHYREVALYTDEEGKHVLIDLLNLPYTEVHVVYDNHKGYLESPLSVEKCMAKYEDFMLAAEKEWRSLPFGSIWSIEKEEANAYKDVEAEGFLSSRLCLNPYLKLFEIPEDWPAQALSILRKRLSLSPSMNRFWIGLVPRLGADGVKNVGIGRLGVNIIRSLSQSELTVKEVINSACACIEPGTMPENDKFKLVMKEMEYLMYFGIVILRKEGGM